jgi:outer membrane protein TolC
VRERRYIRLSLIICFAVLLPAANGLAQAPDRPDTLPPPRSLQETLAEPGTLLPPDSKPIDLPTALRLAGVDNPEIQLAQQRVVEAVARQQLAAAQILPNVNVGLNLNHHLGTLQRFNGTIFKVNRDAMFIGLGASAVGSGTVTIPGIVWSGNVSEVYYRNLISRQLVQEREFASEAARNDVLLRVASAYLDLLRATARRAIGHEVRADAREVARVTGNFAITGQGRQSDADRAATEFEQRNNEVLQAEGDMLTSSARLCQLLRLDPSVRLHPADGWAVPRPLVPDPIPLPELLSIALMQRPELRERRAAIQGALLQLDSARLLPFSPNLLLGYSAGTFGGGSNLVANGVREADGNILRQPRFDSFGGRQDLDVVMFWALRNLGVGNVASVRLARSNVRQAELSELEVLDRVRAEVAAARARTHARFAQSETNERATLASAAAFRQDLTRTRNREGLPIEVMDSLRLLGRSRFGYLDAIIDYNRAQFELFVALGQPPADRLARPVPQELVVPRPGKESDVPPP